jgi:putative ABC transport system permease protein
VHFHSGDIEGNSGKKGNISYIYVFLIVACFMVFIACINYMNLSTARFSNRGKEIAIRKVSGASRATLVKQFLAEAFVVTLISVLISLLAVYLILPAFNAFTEKTLILGIQSDRRLWVGLFIVTTLVALLAGLYPAIFQSGLDPMTLLKGRIQLGKGNISLRRLLVVFQFVVSIVLIAATIIIFEQMRYVNHKDMGFERDKLVVVDIVPGHVRRSVSTVREEFSKLPQVRSATVSSTVPGAWKVIPSAKVVRDNGDPGNAVEMYYSGVDDRFLSTYNIKLLNGRNFFSTGKGDSTSVLVNESAAKALGITEAKGQSITIPSVRFGSDNRSRLEKSFTANVVGIVKDFNFQSLHEPLAPMVMGFQVNPVTEMEYITVKLSGGETEKTLQKMNGILKSLDQDYQFEYHFLDAQWDLLYRSDKVRQTIFLLASLLAILIAALGLLGLTIYAAQQRVKEIGVRKVLGASVGGIVMLLSKDFLKLVLVAAVIAIPVAWYFMSMWLQDFAYRIHISLWVFVMAALAAVLIALATTFVQVLKAAVANPVKSLRAE